MGMPRAHEDLLTAWKTMNNHHLALSPRHYTPCYLHLALLPPKTIHDYITDPIDFSNWTIFFHQYVPACCIYIYTPFVLTIVNEH